MTKTVRPALLPDSRAFVLYPLLFALFVSPAGLVLHRVLLVTAPLIIAVVPGILFVTRLIYFLLVKIEISNGKIVYISHVLGNGVMKLPVRQEVSFIDVAYLYAMEKEIAILGGLRKRLAKYDVSEKETDYTREHLTLQYDVDDSVFAAFDHSAQKALTDYTATAVMRELDRIYDQYKFSRVTRKEIKGALGNEYTFEKIAPFLEAASVSEEDIASVQDEFADLDVPNVAPFLRTCANLVRFQKLDKGRGIPQAVRIVNMTIVLSDHDGSKKLYMPHFYFLSRRSRLELIKILDLQCPAMKYLVTKAQYKALHEEK